MQLLEKISGFLSKKAKPVTFLDSTSNGWSWFGLGVHRQNTRIPYNQESSFIAYRSHELVYACINKIADVMNDAEIIVETKNGKGEWEKKEGHPLTALFKRPNSYQTGRDVRRLMVQSEQSFGFFYAFLNRSGAGNPVEISLLNPNQVVVRWNANQDAIEYYEYQKRNGSVVKIRPEDMIIRRRPDLLDQFFGFAPLQAALKSINSDLGFTDYVDAFFESDGTPSGILKILNATVKNERREELQRLWKLKYGRGGSNQKGVAVLDQNAEFQKIGSNLDELASAELTGRFESRICAVFGVPPNLVGAYVGLEHVTANATAKAELNNFWDNKISPELASLREWLTWFFLPEFEGIDAIKMEKIRVSFDVSHAAFLQEDVDARHKRARENFKAGLWKLNEARQETGQAPDDEAGDDYYVQPSTLIAISPERRAADAIEEPVVPAQLLQPGEEPSDGETSEEDEEADDKTEEGSDDEEDDEKILKIPLEKKTFDYEGLTLGREPSELEKLLDLKAIVADLESEKAKSIKILKRFREDLIDQACSKLDKLSPQTAHTLILIPDPKIRKDLEKAIASSFKTGRDQVSRELRAQDAEKSLDRKDEFDNDWLDYLDELVDGMISKTINEISMRAINEYLTLKMLVDYTIEKLQDLLLAQSDKFIERIAGGAVNAAIQSGRSAEAESQTEAWSSVMYSAVLDANTCGPCADADGETAASEEDLPAAPNPECEGQDRCRCFHVFVTA